jgi:enoyl-CoA hydratase
MQIFQYHGMGEAGMPWSTLLIEKNGKKAVLTLNRPERMNSLNSKLIKELIQALGKCCEDDSVRVVVIQGNHKVFCAGTDIAELNQIANLLDGYAFLVKVRDLFRKIELFPKPVIAAVEGLALGGGCELALACDLRLAAESAEFGLPEIDLGALPGGGGTSRLPRIVGLAKAKEMVFLGERVSAREAYRIGMVNQVFSNDIFREEVSAFSHRLTKKSKKGIYLAKLSMDYGLSVDLNTARDVEVLFGAVALSSSETKEGVKAFLEKRKPNR